MQIEGQDIAGYTAELVNSSIVSRFQKRDQGWKEAKGDVPIPDVWRKIDTVQGFLTKEKVEEIFSGPDADQLLITSGLNIVSDRKAFFLTDDSEYGYQVLPSSFRGCIYTNLQFQHGPGQKFGSVDEILARYCDGLRYLGSVEELAKYVLTGE